MSRASSAASTAAIQLPGLASASAAAVKPAAASAEKATFDVSKALSRALGGGLSGAAAMVVQVCTLMPMRTTMNYQYRYGTSTTQALSILYKDGGVFRFYRGILPALFQGPLSRFGDTAANAGILAYMQSSDIMKRLPVALQTVFASAASASFRMVLTPIDTLKTTMQTQGADAMGVIRRRIATNGVQSLWYGSTATAAATFVGHYPWFATYNLLNEKLPQQDTKAKQLGRQAIIGFSASVISDTCSNSIRVLKTYRQVNETKVSYVTAAKTIIAKDGWSGLFGRGLKTRIMTNGLQGIMFSVLWKVFQDKFNA